jgi:electron-transferring-flavoprotein dehydrogenase
MDAIADGRADDEDALWAYNRRVQTDFGKRFAAMDLYNIWGGTYDVDELVDIVSAMPGQQLADALALEGTTSMGWPLKLKTAINTFGHWSTLFELKKLNDLATELKSVYDDYPATSGGLDLWRSRRDAVMDEVYELTGAEPKY